MKSVRELFLEEAKEWFLEEVKLLWSFVHMMLICSGVLLWVFFILWMLHT